MFSLLKIIQTYNSFKAKKYTFQNNAVSIDVQNLEVSSVRFLKENPSAAEIQDVMNKAVKAITSDVKSQFGF